MTVFDIRKLYNNSMKDDLTKQLNNFKSVIELVHTFSNEKKCIKFLEEIRWGNEVVSPFDKTSKVYKCKGNNYRCRKTGKYFNVKTGTLFENTKVDLQTWFVAIYLITSNKKGVSSVQLSKALNVTQKTAWFILGRIRNCFKIENDNILNNEVEIDETYVGGKNKNRHFDKKVENSQGRSTKDKVAVLGMIERNGKLNAKTVEDTHADTLTKEIIKRVKDSANLYTDEYLGYKGIAKLYNHSVVKHNAGQYVDGNVYTNSIEGFWSILKRGIFGIYHFTSKKHLQIYIDEFVYRYNTRFMNECERFTDILENMFVRTRYQDLIAA